MARYRVLKGIDYPPNKRAEVGDSVDDLPANAIKWLLEIEAIEDSSKPAKKAEVIVEQIVETPIVEEPVEFKADAIDGDNDGLVQDGTPFERPIEEK